MKKKSSNQKMVIINVVANVFLIPKIYEVRILRNRTVSVNVVFAVGKL